jgi:predicted lipoprotein with Yx(FWY)xxD motif
VALAGLLAIAGCGSSNSYGGGSSSSTATNEGSSSSTHESGPGYGSESTSGGGGESSGNGTVSTGSASDVGTVLVDSNGMTLYYFEKDKGGKSSCYGECASAWPPLTTNGSPKAMGSADSSKLGTTKRSDGTTQVTYAGWPLYTYQGDSQPGEDSGTDSKAFGASWYPLHSNGEKAGS